MASLPGFSFTLVVIFMAASVSVEAAGQFKVGDDFGWQQPNPDNADFYNQWAERNRFQIGDSLAFEYQNDSVLTVEKWDYYQCDASDPITAFDNGKSMITLDRPGPFYFISGIHHHCINGQRLIIDVMSPHPNPPPAASPPSLSPALPPDQASPPSQLGPSPSSSPTSTTSGSYPVSSSPVLKSDYFMAFLLVIFLVMLI